MNHLDHGKITQTAAITAHLADQDTSEDHENKATPPTPSGEGSGAATCSVWFFIPPTLREWGEDYENLPDQVAVPLVDPSQGGWMYKSRLDIETGSAWLPIMVAEVMEMQYGTIPHPCKENYLPNVELNRRQNQN